MSLIRFSSTQWSPFDEMESETTPPTLRRRSFILMNPSLLRPRVRNDNSFIDFHRRSTSLRSSRKILFEEEEEDTIVEFLPDAYDFEELKLPLEDTSLERQRHAKDTDEIEKILIDLSILNENNQTCHNVVAVTTSPYLEKTFIRKDVKNGSGSDRSEATAATITSKESSCSSNVTAATKSSKKSFISKGKYEPCRNILTAVTTSSKILPISKEQCEPSGSIVTAVTNSSKKSSISKEQRETIGSTVELEHKPSGTIVVATTNSSEQSCTPKLEHELSYGISKEKHGSSGSRNLVVSDESIDDASTLGSIASSDQSEDDDDDQQSLEDDKADFFLTGNFDWLTKTEEEDEFDFDDWRDTDTFGDSFSYDSNQEDSIVTVDEKSIGEPEDVLPFEGTEVTNNMVISAQDNDASERKQKDGPVDWQDPPLLMDLTSHSDSSTQQSSVFGDIDEVSIPSTLQSLDVVPSEEGYEINLVASGQEVTVLQYYTSTMLSQRFFTKENTSFEKETQENPIVAVDEPEAEEWLNAMFSDDDEKKSQLERNRAGSRSSNTIDAPYTALMEYQAGRNKMGLLDKSLKRHRDNEIFEVGIEVIGMPVDMDGTIEV
jgi:hypothetical protein